MTSTIRNKELLVRFIERVWNNEDLQAVDEYVAPLYTIHHDPGDPWDGQTLDTAGFKARLKRSRAPFPDQSFKIEYIIGEDDKLAAAWKWRGTHLGEIAGIPPSGRTITMSGLTVYYFERSRLCGHWQVADRLGVYRQLTGAG